MERFTGWTGYHTYDPRGSVSKGVANAADMISENVSHAVKDKVKDLMEAAVKASVMIVCSDTVQFLDDVGNAIFSFIVRTVYGALEPASVLLDFLIESGGYDSAAFELGRIVGNAAAVAAILGMFLAGGAISGAFMGGAMALSLGTEAAVTVTAAAGAVVVTAKANSSVGALNSLIAEMSGASNSGGKGTEEEGKSDSIDEDKIFESASQPKKGGETVAGHALQKHAGRNPDIWGKVSGNSENINNTAMKHIKEILDAPGDFQVVESNGHTFLEKILPDRRGIRLNMDGTFKGFIDQIR